MAELILTFKELYERVSKFLGTYPSDGKIAAEDLADAKQIVNDAYRRLLDSAEWSFLKKHTFLITTSGTWVYDLPTDFVDLIGTFTFDSDETYAPLEERPVDVIMNWRAVNTYSQYPEYFAIRQATYNKETGQKKELLLYPTPDAAYTLWYSYSIYPEKLENDNDIPIGGPEYSSVLRQLCLAEAESQMDEKIDVQETKARAMLADAIAKDRRRVTKTLGYFGDGQRLSLRDIHRGPYRINNVNWVDAIE